MSDKTAVRKHLRMRYDVRRNPTGKGYIVRKDFVQVGGAHELKRAAISDMNARIEADAT